MPDSSISTGTTFPQFAFAPVARPELYVRLDTALAARGRVLLITAPAGTGKTVLVTQWAREHLCRTRPGLRIGWVTATPGGPLAPAVAAALGVHAVPTDDTVRADPAADAAQLTATLRADSRPTVLILDDAHLTAGPADLSYLRQLLTDAPPNLTTVLAARHAPALRWHTVELRQRMIRMHAADLAFGEVRAAQLCRGRHHDLSDPELAMLMGLTRGWPALITLAAGHLAGHADTATALAALAEPPASIAEFFTDEVLAPLSGPQRQFARITSVPGAFTAGLAEQLTGDSAVPVLRELVRAGFPATRHARDGDLWFTYHPLLRAHLLTEARDHHDLPALHVRAADWYRRARMPQSALHHLLRVPSSPRLPGFLRDTAMRMVLDGHGPALFRQLEHGGPIPADDPLLHALRAVDAVERDDTAEAVIRLDLLHRRPADTGTLAPETWIRLLTAAASAGVALRTGVGLAEFRLPDRLPATGQPDLDAYAAVRFGTVALAHDDLRTAEQHLRHGLALADAAGNAALSVRASVRLAIAAGVRGAIARMHDHAAHAVTVAARHGLGDHLEVDRACTLAAFAGYLRGEPVEPPPARTAPAAGRERHLEVVTRLLAFDTAEDRYTAAEAVRRSTVVLLRRPLPLPTVAGRLLPHVVSVLLGVAAVHSARLLVDQAATVLGDSPDLTLARAAVALEQHPGTTHTLVEPLLTTSGTTPGIVSAWLLAAAAHTALGNPPQARRAIAAAVHHAAPQRLVRPFLDVPGTRELLDAHTGTFGHDNDFAALVRHHPALARRHRPPRLTPTERTVLDQLPSGRTAQQIADVLGVSINTVKTHLRGIHAKLGSSTRADALDLARRSGLL
ncbi:LuxR C-terminal-related transcriptional regulator [Nocardia wallacei]|uniref:LuxR C-terminal-related transcriptional regulator n=1 Tax=Nocardia wallacei TaxID=480035 RepID=UPI002454ED4E|nr:LuxR C-terminal-related transcriptional regulator [Nocardia wallacei]